MQHLKRVLLRSKGNKSCTNLSICAPVWCPAGCSHPPNCGAGGNCAPSYSSPWRSEASLLLCADRWALIIQLWETRGVLWCCSLSTLQGFGLLWWRDVTPSALSGMSTWKRSMRTQSGPRLPGVARTGVTAAALPLTTLQKTSACGELVSTSALTGNKKLVWKRGRLVVKSRRRKRTSDGVFGLCFQETPGGLSSHDFFRSDSFCSVEPAVARGCWCASDQQQLNQEKWYHRPYQRSTQADSEGGNAEAHPRVSFAESLYVACSGKIKGRGKDWADDGVLNLACARPRVCLERVWS